MNSSEDQVECFYSPVAFFFGNMAFFVSTYVDIKSRYVVAMIYVRGL